MWREMAPQQTTEVRTAFLVNILSLRKDSMASYSGILTLFSTIVRGLDVLYNALNVS